MMLTEIDKKSITQSMNNNAANRLNPTCRQKILQGQSCGYMTLRSIFYLVSIWMEATSNDLLHPVKASSDGETFQEITFGHTPTMHHLIRRWDTLHYTYNNGNCIQQKNCCSISFAVSGQAAKIRVFLN